MRELWRAIKRNKAGSAPVSGSLFQIPGRLPGQLTIFLSLILMLIISFLLALSENAWIQLAKGESRSVSTMALDSVFGEYHKDLMEIYGLLFLDGSYLSGSFSEEKILNRYRAYISYETDMGKGVSSLGNPVNWHIDLSQVTITDMELATDQDGAAFRAQISEYMEEKLGIGLIQELTGTDEKLEQQTQVLEAQENQYEALQIDDNIEAEAAGQISAGQAAADGGEENAQAEENAAIEADSQALLEGTEALETVSELKSRGILEQVLEDPESVSDKKVNPETLASHRTLKQGYGTHPWTKGRALLLDNILFREYLNSELACYGDTEHDPKGLEYELEYMIAGKESDMENLKSVMNRLMILRTAANYLYLMGNAEMKGEVELVAAVISMLLFSPEIEKAVTMALLAAWAYGESLMECKTLLNGGKVPIIASSENWLLPFSELVFVDGMKGKSLQETGENGLSYREWLHLLLYTQSTHTQTMRLMDLIETAIRAEQGNSSFCMDSCVAGVTVANTWNLKRGTQYSFPVSYGYQ